MSLALYGAHSGVISDMLASQSLLNRAIVDEVSARRVATSTAGSPAAGFFHSSISGRADIPDISQDLKVNFGVERFSIQSIAPVQSEAGPSNEPVWSVLGDDRGLIRLIGSGWAAFGASVGSGVGKAPNVNGTGMWTTIVGDSVEFTFYGTGVNCLFFYNNSANTYNITIDGSAAGSVSTTASYSTTINSKNTSINAPISLASGLSLGVHTVRLTYASGSTFAIHGFEVINTSSATSLTVNPGSAYLNGIKKQLTTQSTSLLVKPTSLTGTKGGRVVVYLGADGNVGQAVQAVDTLARSFSYAGTGYAGTAANHANEEVLRIHNFREFSAGRTDDMSSIVASGGNNGAFTLEDNTTSLSANTVDRGGGSGSEMLRLGSASGYVHFTFVGTGLDYIIPQVTGTVADSIQIYVDGVNTGNVTGLARNAQTRRIVSGLPYGTHNVRILQASGAPANTEHIHSFIVYGPKKPSIPTGAVELADYFVMADFSANTAAELTFAKGVLSKGPLREWVYVGSGWGSGQWTPSIHGEFVQTSTASDYCEYTFTGTGFDVRQFLSNGGTFSIQVQLQNITAGGSLQNFTTANFGAPATGAATYGSASYTWNAATGQLALASIGSAVNSSGFYASGLTYGTYKIRLTRISGTVQGPSVHGIDIITPIHCARDKAMCIQNTAPTGSCSMKDSRNVKLIDDKAWTSIHSISSQSLLNNSGGNTGVLYGIGTIKLNKPAKVKVSLGGFWQSTAINMYVAFRIFIDSIEASASSGTGTSVAANMSKVASMETNFSWSDTFYLPAGVHCVHLSTITFNNTANLQAFNMMIEEVP